jgi:cysteine synthase
MQSRSVDTDLLKQFHSEFVDKAPHLSGQDGEVVNPTPLVDITDAFLECAKSEYGLDLSPDQLAIFGKFDSKIPGGSVKVRPALRILEDALASGKLTKGKTVFEATSGNFGLALSILKDLDLDVVVLVSRRLQAGVSEELRAKGLKLVNLDIDICPAPGLQGDADLLVAKGVAASVRQQLSELGLDPGRFDSLRASAERLLARQDAIGLAKLLAEAYEGFCPSQYDNDLNMEVHETVTGPEIDQQLRRAGFSLGDAELVSAFGTGGTATGVSKYVAKKYGRKAVRVVFPLSGQDVAGIRTKEKATGLKFYTPSAYLGEHEIDFEPARRAMAFLNRAGYDVGESGALAFYAAIQLVNYGVAKKLVIMVADGASKYAEAIQTTPSRIKLDEVTLKEAAAGIGDYGEVIWTHSVLAPKEAGLRVIASSLGYDASSIKVAKPSDVQALISGKSVPETFAALLPKDGKPALLVCMAGNTSLFVAKALARQGIEAQSLVGGISRLPESSRRQPFELVQPAKN